MVLVSRLIDFINIGGWRGGEEEEGGDGRRGGGGEGVTGIKGNKKRSSVTLRNIHWKERRRERR